MRPNLYRVQFLKGTLSPDLYSVHFPPDGDLWRNVDSSTFQEVLCDLKMRLQGPDLYGWYFLEGGYDRPYMVCTFYKVHCGQT